MTGNESLALAHWDVIYSSMATIIASDQITMLVCVTSPIEDVSVDMAFRSLIRIL